MRKNRRKEWTILSVWAAGFCLLLTACVPRIGKEASSPPPPRPAPPPCHLGLKTLGYTIQMGAFSRVDYAVRLQEKLKSQGFDAFYFLHDDGLYKVRSGNFRDYEDARSVAMNLRDRDLIGEFFILSPQSYSVERMAPGGCDALRDEIVRTANRFIGIPYRWGGASAEGGFDCSGLTMVVYRLNGLDLPRASNNQFDSGRPVSGRELRKGDLVFFSTRHRKRVSHVGIYLGDGQFIHAPRRGQKVQISSLTSGYYASRFIGGRTYL